MSNSWSKLAFVAVVATATLSSATYASAQGTPKAADEIRLERLFLKDADMVTATKTLTDMTGLQFIIEPSDLAFGKVTVRLQGISAEDALKYICEAAGAYYRRDENGVFIISHTKPAPLNPDNALTSVGQKKQSITKKIKLLHADPREVYERLLDISPLGKNGQVFDTRVWSALKDFKDMYKDHLDAPLHSNVSLGQPMAQPIGTSYVSAPTTGRDNTSGGNQIVLPGESANQIGGGFGGGGQGGLGGGGLGGGGLGGGGLGGGGLGGGQGGLGGGQQTQLQGGQGYVPSGIEHITYDPTDNTIVVESASDDDIARLQRIVALFDTVPKQVTIKVEFITTSKSLDEEIGYDWLYSRGTILAGNTPGAFATSGDPIFLNFSSGNVTTRLRSQLLISDGKEDDAPILRTLNNQPASLSQTRDIYYETTSVVSAGSGNVVTAPSIGQLSATTGLTVAPRINDDGTITMYLNPSVQSFQGLRQLADGTSLPDQTSQTLQVVARVISGQTIVLGGLITKNDTTNVNKYPILGDIPILGQFFRHTAKSFSDQELLIFVTPTIIEEDNPDQGV